MNTPPIPTPPPNPPAFPHDGGPGSSGMDLRDYFATQAMNGDLSSQSQETGEYDTKSIPMLVERAYRIADAMLDERAKK